jgi:hypothetical protein
MNQTNIVEMMQRRTAQFMILSAVFVGMMVFLLPSLIEEAKATVTARATSTAGPSG